MRAEWARTNDSPFSRNPNHRIRAIAICLFCTLPLHHRTLVQSRTDSWQGPCWLRAENDSWRECGSTGCQAKGKSDSANCFLVLRLRITWVVDKGDILAALLSWLPILAYEYPCFISGCVYFWIWTNNPVEWSHIPTHIFESWVWIAC